MKVHQALRHLPSPSPPCTWPLQYVVYNTTTQSVTRWEESVANRCLEVAAGGGGGAIKLDCVWADVQVRGGPCALRYSMPICAMQRTHGRAASGMPRGCMHARMHAARMPACADACRVDACMHWRSQGGRRAAPSRPAPHASEGGWVGGAADSPPIASRVMATLRTPPRCCCAAAALCRA